MNLWSDIVGQDDAARLLKRAAAVTDASDRGMTHSWLITGPPGSGRSNLAYAFAADLLSPAGEELDERVHRQVASRSHADLVVLATEGVTITVAAAREAARKANFAPSSGRYRVVVVEDADRMNEQAANALLKAIEEPPEQTVWILCAPSEADLLPTIRSRVRSLVLHVPTVDDVARLLHERDGVELELARTAAREAQSHIGMAKRLATDEAARERRAKTVDAALRITGVGAAVRTAQLLVDIANEDAKSLGEEQLEEQEAHFMRQMGLAPGATVPRQMRGQLSQFRKAMKDRERRGVRDGVDRVLVDLLSVFRDALLIAIGRQDDLVNFAERERIAEFAAQVGPDGALAILDALSTARERIEGNVPVLLAIEAALVTVAERRGLSG